MLDYIARATLSELDKELITQDPRLEGLILIQVKLLTEVLLAYIESKERKMATSQGDDDASQET